MVSRTWLLLFLALAFPALARAGALQDVEEAASRPSNADDEDDSSDRSRGDATGESYQLDLDEQRTSGGTSIWAHIFLAPWSLPRALMDDPCFAGYATYPYHDAPGQLRHVLLTDTCARANVERPKEARLFAAQMDFEAGYVLDDVVAASFAARVQMPQRLELSGRFSVLQDLAARPHEQALSGFTHLALRFAQSARVDLRTGIGLRAFSLHRPLYGFDLVYAMDVYSERPVMAHLELHIGNLGRALAAQARMTVGVQLWKLELYAGYDHTVFFGASKARLGGPVLGLRAWF